MANGIARLSSKKIRSGTYQQTEALRTRTGLDTGLPSPLSVLEAAVIKQNALEAAQAAAKQALKLATDAVQQGLFELRGRLNANKATAAMIYGPYSPEFINLGGKPRKGRRKGSGVAADATATPAPGVTTTASSTEAA